jgi:hypothetical protein
MASAVKVTETEILEALAAAMEQKGPEGARTMAELQQATGQTAGKITVGLKSLQAQGRLRVHRTFRMAIDGTRRISPAYEVLPAKKGK